MASSQRFAPLIVIVVLALGLPASRAQQPTPPAIDMRPVAPESVGFSAERLERLHAAIQEEIDQKQLAGLLVKPPLEFRVSQDQIVQGGVKGGDPIHLQAH